MNTSVNAGGGGTSDATRIDIVGDLRVLAQDLLLLRQQECTYMCDQAEVGAERVGGWIVSKNDADINY